MPQPRDPNVRLDVLLYMAGTPEATRKPKVTGEGGTAPASLPGAVPAFSLHWFAVPRFVDSDGQTTIFRAERPYQLLAYLACRSDWVARDELATLLWPDHDQSAARRNLRKVLLVAERIPGLPALERQGDRVRFAPDSDLAQLEAQAHPDGTPTCSRSTGRRSWTVST